MSEIVDEKPAVSPKKTKRMESIPLVYLKPDKRTDSTKQRAEFVDCEENTKENTKDQSKNLKNLKTHKNTLYTGKGDSGQTSLYNGKKVDKTDHVLTALGAVEKLQQQIGLLHTWISSLKNNLRQKRGSGIFGFTNSAITMFLVGLSLLAIFLGVWSSDAAKITQPKIAIIALFVVVFVFAAKDVLKNNLKTIRADSTQQPDYKLVNEIRDFLPLITHDLYKMMSDIGVPIETGPNLYIVSRFDRADRIEEFETMIKRMDQDIPTISNFVLPIGGIIACNCGVTRSMCREAELIVCKTLNEEQKRPNVYVKPITSYLNRLSSFLFALELFMRIVEGKPLVFTTQFEKAK